MMSFEPRNIVCPAPSIWLVSLPLKWLANSCGGEKIPKTARIVCGRNSKRGTPIEMKYQPLRGCFVAVCFALAAFPLAAKQTTIADTNVAPGSDYSPDEPVRYTARVDPLNVLVDHFQGWGVSLCWWANIVGGYSNRDEYADLIFNTLKLNIVRYNIGGGENPNHPHTKMRSYAAMQGFEPSPGVWDWDADRNQRWILKAAVARGVNRIEAFANSPPYWMTVSGSVTGGHDGSANLKESCEQDFAAYLAEVVRHLSQSDGVTFDTVTPVNEPSSGWWKYGGRQEGCHIGAHQEDRLIILLRAELNKRGLYTLIDTPEDNDEKATINDLRNYTRQGLMCIGQIATHSYGANDPEGLHSLALYLHKPLRQSEYGDGEETGLKTARRIHDDLVHLRPLSWCLWQAVGGSWGLLDNSLRPGASQTISISQKFYSFEQFTRFIRPGFDIIACGDHNSVAGYDPESQTLVIVTVNDHTRDFVVTYDLGGFGMTGPTVQPYRTSDYENCSQLAPLNVTNHSFVSAIPAKSVTTFVLKGVR